jgi:hypothetical protein
LKDHANPLPERDDIRSRLIDILSIKPDRSFNAGVEDKFIQAVESSKKGGFTASGRPDQSSDLALFDNDVNIFEGMEGPIIKIKVLGLHLEDGIQICHWRIFRARDFLILFEVTKL